MKVTKIGQFCVFVAFVTLIWCGCGVSDHREMPIGNVNTNAEEHRKEEGVKQEMNDDTFIITANGTTFIVDFADNSSAEALKKLLQTSDITINMHDYGNFEKVGSLGASLPTNDENITTQPGDVILYQGNQITIYYDTNSWSFTRLGRIRNATKKQLLQALGDGKVTVTISLNK